MGSVTSVARAKLYEKALAIFREIGDRRGTAIALNDLGMCLDDAGEVERAHAAYTEAVAIDRELDDREALASTLTSLATNEAKVGDRALARELFQESMRLAAELGSPIGIAVGHLNLASLRADEGDLSGARRELDTALSQAHRLSATGIEAYCWWGSGQILLARNRLQAARAALEHAVAMATASGESLAASGFRLELAREQLEEGNVVEAESTARQAVAGYAESGASMVSAYGLLARIEIAAGRVEAAREAVAAGAHWQEKDHAVEAAAELSVARARVLLAEGDYAGVVRDVGALVPRMRGLWSPDREYEASLLLWQAEALRGNVALARRELSQLVSRASHRGFALAARNGRRMLAAPPFGPG